MRAPFCNMAFFGFRVATVEVPSSGALSVLTTFRIASCTPSRSLTDARRTRYLLDLVADLGRAYLEGRLDRRMRVYLAPKVLIIDEMGYLPLDELGATSFFQLEHFAAIDLEVQ